jgi:membrane protein
VTGTASATRALAVGVRKRITDHDLTLVAAGVAFYAFLALVPALIAIVSIYGLFSSPEDVTRQVEDIGSSLPSEVQEFLVYQLTQIVDASSAGVSLAALVAIAVALWSASGGVAALITGVHIAHEKDEPTSFVEKRGKALLLTVAAILFLGAVIFLLVAVPPLASDVAGSTGRTVFQILRWPVLAAAMLLGIGLLYRLSVKDTESGWAGFLTKGTVVAMVAWLAVSGLFAVYTANFASYGKTYGALASIVVVLLWLWLSSLAILVGAEVDGADEG